MVATGWVSTLALTVAVGSGLITGCGVAQPVMSNGNNRSELRIKSLRVRRI
jgi:hypothetical protein